MDELIDILDEQGNITGNTCMKSKAHLKGYWHLCIHVWLYTKEGEVLIQKRIQTKDTFPNKWDISVAGHVGAGENLHSAAQREVLEEVGLSVNLNDLQFIGNFFIDIKHNEFLIDREYCHVYITELKNSIEDLCLQEEEVAEVELIPLSELKERLVEKEEFNFVPYSEDYFSLIFEAIQDAINF